MRRCAWPRPCTDDPTHTPDALIAHADSAMYRAKQRGPGQLAVFDPHIYAADRALTTSRDELTSALPAALRHGELELYYQPIIALAPTDEWASTALSPASAEGGVHAVEALLRWHHPHRGLLTAHDFIPAAARAGMMVVLGSWVLRTACRQLAAWDAELRDTVPTRIFVNASVHELTDPGMAGRVSAALTATGLAAQRLTLEVTETELVADLAGMHTTLQELSALGCGLAIDDFGTGHSSLSRLVHIPAATLKLDKSFTRGLRDTPTESCAVLAAVLQLGRELHRQVIVEGVEDAASLQTLRDLDCTYAQGYHLGIPQPHHQLTATRSPGDEPVPAVAHANAHRSARR